MDDVLFAEAAARVEAGLSDDLDFGELAVFRRFAAAMQDKLAYDHDERRWYIWNGNIWKKDLSGRAEESFIDFVEAERARVTSDEDDLALSRLKFWGSVERSARFDKRLAVHSAMWDADGWLVGTPGGVIDLRTGSMRPPNPRDYIQKSTLCEIGPAGGPSPIWTAFLDEATNGDKDLQAFLQRWIGYCLTGQVSEEVLAFIYGDGGNGKGVFAGAIAAVFGDYAVAMPMDAFVANSRKPQEYYLAQMVGARMVTATETESGHHWAESQIKELTGNETPVSARHPFGRPFTFKPLFKLQFVGNHAPSLKGRSPAMERRLRIVPFNHKPPVVNLHLKEQLAAEYPAILRWIVDGALAWQAQGLGTSPVIVAAGREYFVSQDGFGRWMEDHCILDTGLSVQPAMLFRDYRDWCKTNGEAALTNPEFAEQINRVPGCRRVRPDQLGPRLIQGIGLKPPTSDSSPDDDCGSWRA